MLDRHGALARYLQPLKGPPPQRNLAKEIPYLGKSLVNWTLFGTNVLRRGEAARALEILMIVDDTLVHIARLQAGSTHHWITSTKNLEHELPPEAYARFSQATASLDLEELWKAYSSAWYWGNEMLRALAEENQAELPVAIMTKLEKSLAQFW